MADVRPVMKTSESGMSNPLYAIPQRREERLAKKSQKIDKRLVGIVVVVAVMATMLVITTTICIALGIEMATMKNTESENTGKVSTDNLTRCFQKLSELEEQFEHSKNSKVLPDVVAPQSSTDQTYPSLTTSSIVTAIQNTRRPLANQHPKGTSLLSICNGVMPESWRLIAYINTTESCRKICPKELSCATDISSCVQKMDGGGCSRVKFKSRGIAYSHVCGRIIGRHSGLLNGFGLNRLSETLDENYVDGVSLTYGDPRTHIWTFAANSYLLNFSNCNVCYLSQPRFVPLSHYSCSLNPKCSKNKACGEGLWQDNLCSGDTWFHRQLPHPTEDDLEMRLCRKTRFSGDIGLTLVEIYVV